MLAIWSLVPLPFLKPAWTSESSQFTYCWSLAWRILSITLLECEMSAIVQYFEHSLALPSFGIGMKTDLFQSCGHCWVFQICWHIECSTFTASSYRIWNSSTGILSPPLALFVVMITGKTIGLTRWTFVGKVMSVLFNMLSTLVITFLPRSKHLWISWLQSPSAEILDPRKIKSATVSTVSPSICHEVMGLDAMVLVFWMLSFKSTFSLFLFHCHQEAL